MEKAVEFIKAQGIGSLEELRETIGNIKSLLSLDRFALVDEDNIVYTRYTTYTGGSRHSFLSGGEMKDRKISTVSIYGSSKQLCLAAPTPGLKIAGKPYKACFVQIDFREIVDLLAFEDEGRTYFGLYNKNGENLSDTELGPYVSKHNLFETMRGVIPEEEWNANHDNFTNAVDGSVSFTVNGVAETLCYVPVEENIAKDEVVISIGYSTLTPEDKLLHDVFERADQMMYDRKKQLKAMGAKTRSDS